MNEDTLGISKEKLETIKKLLDAVSKDRHVECLRRCKYNRQIELFVKERIDKMLNNLVDDICLLGLADATTLKMIILYIDDFALEHKSFNDNNLENILDVHSFYNVIKLSAAFYGTNIYK